MKNNKENNKLRMDELIPMHDENPETSFIEEGDFDINQKTFDQEYVNTVKHYNANIGDHLEMYTTLAPMGYEMIVRAFVREPLVTPEGITVPNRQIVGIPTNTGQGFAEVITDPFGYKQKAVVVSVGKNVTEFTSGDVIYLKKQLKAVPLGAGSEVGVYIESSFVHPDSDLIQSPTEPDNPHFGYLLIHEHDALGKDTRGL